MHRKLKQGSTHLQTRTHTHTHVCTYTHVHTHTHTHKGVARTRHNRRRTSAHAHLAGQTGGFRLRWQPLLMSGRGWSTGPRPACQRDCASGSPGPPRCWGRFLEENLSAAQHSASPGPSRPPSPLLDVPQAHRVGRDSPLQPVQSCGTEFSHHSLRVSMPLGGKYKRCLCLKPNMGVSGSPGLCPSFGPGLLARGLGRNER